MPLSDYQTLLESLRAMAKSVFFSSSLAQTYDWKLAIRILVRIKLSKVALHFATSKAPGD